jgi:hypothetical protein
MPNYSICNCNEALNFSGNIAPSSVAVVTVLLLVHHNWLKVETNGTNVTCFCAAVVCLCAATNEHQDVNFT